MTRLACLHVPLFPLAARLRSQPDLAPEPVAIFTGNGHAARVVAATRPARRAGLRPGMTLPQARALVPDLQVHPRDPAGERSAQETLLEIAESFSPRVEDAGEGLVYLDIEGLDRYVSRSAPKQSPKLGPEHDLGGSLAVAGQVAGLPIWVGIASSKLAARVAAEIPDSPLIVAAGEEADFLAPLPLARLTPETETIATLDTWGLHSIGDFAALSKNEVSSRLGRTGHRLHLQARGLDSRPLIPHPSPPVFREGMDLEWPLVNLEPLLFIARGALERLCRRLEQRGLGCARLDLSLRLEPEGLHERSLQLPSPTRDARTLLTLIHLDLEQQPPAAPVVGFTLAAQPDRPREAQLSLLGPVSLPPDRLATTLARLFALMGSERIGSPRTVDGHRPERFALIDYNPPAAPDIRPEVSRSRGLMAVRVLRPPLPVEVVTTTAAVTWSTADSTDSPTPDATDSERPVEILSVVREGSDKEPSIQGRVRVASGPWRLEEAWWSRDPVDRDYWDLELTDGGIYRLYRERRSGQWYADGIYD